MHVYTCTYTKSSIYSLMYIPCIYNDTNTTNCTAVPAEGWEYIQSTRDLVCDLERRVRLAKANVDTMCTLMAGWSEAPLYSRKENKKDCLLNLEVIKYTRDMDECSDMQ